MTNWRAAISANAVAPSAHDTVELSRAVARIDPSATVTTKSNTFS